MSNSTGTIDITNVVSSLQSSFVTWATNYVFGLEIAIPGMEWIALPGISTIDKAIVKGIINLLATSVVMESFFLNTAIKKASQAQDYVDTVTAKNSLPPTTSEDDYAKAEQLEIIAFRNFVSVTN